MQFLLGPILSKQRSEGTQIIHFPFICGLGHNVSIFRSWAASDGTTMSETDTVKRVLLEEQRRGKTHYLPEIIVPEKGNTVVFYFICY